jgi:prophage tail gpP-like protein
VTVTQRQHNVAVVVGGHEVTGWTSYAISSSMIDPVDTAQFTLPWSRAAWDLLKPDQPIKVTIDGVVVLDGHLDDRESPPTDETILISARDRCGRLVQESAPSIDYRGLTLTQLVAKLGSPWFPKVTLSNARNRKVLRGRGRVVLSGNEPVRVDPRPGGKLCEPGQVRMAVIKELADQAELLVWSAGDGTELVVGRPNYEQDVQWRFFRPAPGSSRAAEGNVAIGVKDSTGDRYSRIIVVGAGRGTTTNYGPAVTSRYAEVKDNPATRDGEGKAFSAPKRLLIQHEVHSTAEARAMAAQRMRRANASGEAITVMAPTHGQLVGGTWPTLFCPDTMAHLEDERTGRKGAYLVVACRYESDRGGGERTTLDLVPKGTELSSS